MAVDGDRPEVRVDGASGLVVGDHAAQHNYFGPVHQIPAATRPGPLFPAIVGNPPPVATSFQDREAATSAVRRLVSPPAPGSRTVVVHGDGGVGKTQLAAHLFDVASADLCLWVAATGRSSVVSGFAAAADRLGLTADDDGRAGGDAQEGGRAASRLLGWFRETPQPWFVVLDDLADPGDLVGLWPRGRAGLTLVTTRRVDSALSEDGRDVVDLGVFERAESIAYLRERLGVGRIDALTGADELAGVLGDLPLALAQAAAVVLDDADTCAGYLIRFANREERLAALFPASSSRGTGGRAVHATWSLAVQGASARPPAGVAGRLAELISVLDPNGIPETVVVGEQVARYATPAGVRLTSSSLRQGLRNLARFSVIEHVAEDPRRSVLMHSLAQRATRDSMTGDEVRAAVSCAADSLLACWPEVMADADLSRVLRQNARTLTEVAGDLLWQPAAHALLVRAGTSYGEVGLVNDAATYWEWMQETAVRMLGPEDVQTLVAGGQRARWQAEAGDTTQAVAALEELLPRAGSALGADHPTTLTIRADLLYYRARLLPPAQLVADFRRLLADRRRVLGTEHRDTLTTRANLARMIGEAGEPGQAASAFRELVGDRVRILGTDHVDTLSARGNLVRWLGRAGDPQGAAEAAEALVRDRDRVLGSDHPHTLSARAQVALWKGRSGNYSGAIADYEALLQDRLRILGADHPRTLSTRGNLAFNLRRNGEIIAATAAFESLVVDRTRILGPDHRDTFTARANLAALHHETGQVEAAIAELEAVLRDRSRTLGTEHPDTTRSRDRLSQWRARHRD